MSNLSKKILVTGAAGFLGSHLSEKLAKLGHKVIGIDNMIGGYEDNVPNSIEFQKIDCCDLEKIQKIMKGIDIVYHCAATAHEGLSVFSPFEITKNNYLASVISYLTKKPLVLFRKKNKLPSDRHSVDFKLEYGEATIEVHKNSIEKNEKILIIDDLIATGGTAEAAAKLVKISGGSVAGFIFIINLFDLPGNDLLKKKGYFTESLMEFPGH